MPCQGVQRLRPAGPADLFSRLRLVLDALLRRQWEIPCFVHPPSSSLCNDPGSATRRCSWVLEHSQPAASRMLMGHAPSCTVARSGRQLLARTAALTGELAHRSQSQREVEAAGPCNTTEGCLELHGTRPFLCGSGNECSLTTVYIILRFIASVNPPGLVITHKWSET